jgi:hypothetical protein
VKTVVYTFESPATLAVAGRLAESGRISAVILQRPMTFGGKLALLRRRLRLARASSTNCSSRYYRLFLRAATTNPRNARPQRHGHARVAGAESRGLDVDSINAWRRRRCSRVSRRIWSSWRRASSSRPTC